MLPTVAVTFIAYDQNGGPVAGARILAKLDQTEIYNGFVVPEEVEVLADQNGVATLHLWPNALGVAGSKYRVRAWNPDTGSKFLDTTISVPNTNSSLEQILVQEPYPAIDASERALIAAQAAALSAQEDRVQTGLDRIQTGEDRVQTGLDRVQTGLDRVQTGEDRQAAQTARLGAEDALNAMIDVGTVADNLLAIRTTADNIEAVIAAVPSAESAAWSAEQAGLSASAAYTARLGAEAARDAAAASEAEASTRSQVALNAQLAAQAQAGIATTQATLATTEANRSAVARAAAEVARDAAQLSAGIYPSTATGLAATTVGQYFSVPSALDTEYLILYRHDAGPVATEIKRYPSVAAIEYTVANVIHVKSNGDDSRDGLSWRKAVRTIERALAMAWTNNAPTLIEWAPEAVVYTEGHLDMPDNCVIKATHRTVFVRPKPGFEQRNVFRMGSGCFIEGIMFEGWQLDSMTNPTEGFAVSFRPGAVITRVPYAHKIAVRRVPNWGVIAPPLDRANANPEVGLGGGVILADGAVCSPYSVFPNIMAWGATPVIPNGIGYCAKNGGLINAVNAVSMWAHKHFLALSGGQIILSACSTQFGDYSLHAKGSRDLVMPVTIGMKAADKQVNAALAVQTNQQTLIDAMWTALVAGGYTSGWTSTDETYTRRDAATLLQSLAWTLKTGNEQPMLDFAKGLFNPVGQPVFVTAKRPAFLFSFNKLRDDINALLGVSTTAASWVTQLIAALSSTVTNPVKRKEPSRITAIGHTWTAVMAGVALTKIPPATNQATIADSILEEDEGVVIASGQDDQGNALFVGGLQINADTGELGGPPFDQAVRRVATRAAIARSF